MELTSIQQREEELSSYFTISSMNNPLSSHYIMKVSKDNHRRSSLVTPSSVARRKRRKKVKCRGKMKFPDNLHRQQEETKVIICQNSLLANPNVINTFIWWRLITGIHRWWRRRPAQLCDEGDEKEESGFVNQESYCCKIILQWDTVVTYSRNRL